MSNDCDFQGACASELMNHLKCTSHQPSKNVKDKRKVFLDYRQCYTCKMDFDGYFNLMSHRKNVHPSNKTCRNYASGNCPHGNECWYFHGEQNDNDDNSENFRCNVCDETFKGRGNFMRHKKASHPQSIPICERYLANKCPMNENECWFKHGSASGPKNVSQPKSYAHVTKNLSEMWFLPNKRT